MQNPIPTNPTAQSTSAAPKFVHYVDPIREQVLVQKMKEEQNFPLGVVAGLVGVIVGSVIWALVTVLTDYQIGWMAVLNGFLVGFAIRTVGKGVDKKFGIMGAVLALGSCLLGNLLMAAIIVAREESIPTLEVLFAFVIDPQFAIEVLVAIFAPMDLLFYGIALYEGYRFSFRKISRQEYQSLLVEKPV